MRASLNAWCVTVCLSCRRDITCSPPQFVPCAPGEFGAFEATLIQLAEQGKAAQVQTPKISMRDFEKVRALALLQ